MHRIFGGYRPVVACCTHSTQVCHTFPARIRKTRKGGKKSARPAFQPPKYGVFCRVRDERRLDR